MQSILKFNFKKMGFCRINAMIPILLFTIDYSLVYYSSEVLLKNILA